MIAWGYLGTPKLVTSLWCDLRIKKEGGNLLIVLWAQALCKGPWGGVERERDTRLEELTI